MIAVRTDRRFVYGLVIAACALSVCMVHPTDAATSYVLRSVLANGQVRVQAVQPSKLPKAVRAAAKPVRQYHALLTPNDPEFSLQWNFQVTNIPAAWDAGGGTPFFGDSRVVVAVLDTGAAYAAGTGTIQMPDLAGLHLWTNSGEIAGDGIDNDGNGYVDDVHGWNFVGHNNLPLDDHGHGTHITSIIAAGTNNNHATAGIASGVTVMPLKVLDHEGIGTTLTIAQAIEYAVAQGVNVINLSLGGTEPDDVLKAAIQHAQSHGIIVVAASGNEGRNAINYPARYAETVSVGATQYDGSRAPYSNAGPELSLAAPGGNINVDQNGDGRVDGIPEETCSPQDCSQAVTYYYTGTSQAAAHVTGLVALMDSCLLSHGQSPAANLSLVRDALIGTATDVGPAGHDNATGAGVMNAQAALSAVGCTSTSPSAPSNLTGAASAGGTALSSTRSYPFAKPTFQWSGPSGVTYTVRWGLVGATPTTTTQTATAWQPSIKKSGTYTLEVTATDGTGQVSPSAVMLYRYRAAQLLLSSAGRVQALNSQGTKVRTLSTTPLTLVPTATGGTVTISGEDRYAVGRNGVLDLFQTSGKKTGSLKPLGSSSQLISSAVVRLNNQTSVLAVAATNGSEGRIVDTKGKTLKRFVFANNKLKGLSVAAGDLDGDGIDEIVFADQQGSAVRIYRADGTAIKTVTPLGKKYTGGWAVSVGDVNGDGRAEIVLMPRNNRSTPPVLFLDDQGRTIKTIRLRGLKATDAFQMTVADLTADGKDELVVYAPGKNELTVWTDTGTRKKIISLAAVSGARRLGRLE